MAVLGAVATAAVIGSVWGLARVLRKLAHHRAPTTSAAVHHAAYLSGVAMTVGVVAILLLVLVALLGRWDFDQPGRAGVSRSLVQRSQ